MKSYNWGVILSRGYVKRHSIDLRDYAAYD